MKMLKVSSCFDVNSIDDLRAMPRIFSIDSPKAIKAQKLGVINAIHYAAPHTMAMVGNMCPDASPECINVCLGTESGQAAMRKEGELNNVIRSRIVKARLLMKDRVRYLERVCKAIELEHDKAQAKNMQLVVRLNGSTDLPWHGMKTSNGLSVIDRFPSIQFVDYTKSFKRMFQDMPSNYALTYSVNEQNHDKAIQVLKSGRNVAAVFAERLPESWNGFGVINGDEDDLRHLDPTGVVVGLLPKGNKAKKDMSGFVIRSHL